MTREELEDLLDEVESEDLALAIEILKKREDSWQDWLASPAS